ncbi:MAG: hypothetical protein HYU36_16375 [Planctomycetes bacterium]|nr:hypothetical protein [Planctomycetota bacterium]
MLVDPEVEQEVGRYVSVRLYTDGNPAERAQRNQEYQARHFGNVSLPFFAFYNAQGELAHTHEGTAGKAEFLALLRSVR